ncbi:SDR family NAD(P)-dependent oxidoreductase [Alpinimonas psychrophila]|uniref:NAD(P)-dependent dehydrogenase (Short-subunit alcohol dehydrogenase family) n=1 Tax=Alpinimonas psychrophila TaxID=748908 RepID=A0A7W3PNH4_9MICO|nr:SDR family NAD(P)-dependent oxidoreductase [Alpinimonas psychrophila]MBA8828844.1 NAD(P)-dependent dehydrogenase (short-subunit alcohol dehydrogenase family) [Alpinimonas psychrophila]
MTAFDGHVALITGAGQGLGAAIALELGSLGAAVAVTDVNLANADAIATQITTAGGQAIALPLNTTSPAEQEAAVAATVKAFGKLTLAVNNAGIGTPSALVGDLDLEAWNHMINVNLNGVAYGLRYQIPAMLASGGGAIVNMSSVLGSIGVVGVPAAYTAAKHGVVGLTKNAALEYADQGIRINSVGPAFIKTPLLANLPDEALPALAASHPMGRLGEPEEVSALVCFLLSDRASFITGGYYLIDGGYTAR